jgi:hypothetical protein
MCGPRKHLLLGLWWYFRPGLAGFVQAHGHRLLFILELTLMFVLMHRLFDFFLSCRAIFSHGIIPLYTLLAYIV